MTTIVDSSNKFVSQVETPQLKLTTSYTVATLPAVVEGQVVYVTDGYSPLYIGRSGTWEPATDNIFGKIMVLSAPLTFLVSPTGIDPLADEIFYTQDQINNYNISVPGGFATVAGIVRCLPPFIDSHVVVQISGNVTANQQWFDGLNLLSCARDGRFTIEGYNGLQRSAGTSTYTVSSGTSETFTLTVDPGFSADARVKNFVRVVSGTGDTLMKTVRSHSAAVFTVAGQMSPNYDGTTVVEFLEPGDSLVISESVNVEGPRMLGTVTASSGEDNAPSVFTIRNIKVSSDILTTVRVFSIVSKAQTYGTWWESINVAATQPTAIFRFRTCAFDHYNASTTLPHVSVGNTGGSARVLDTSQSSLFRRTINNSIHVAASVENPGSSVRLFACAFDNIGGNAIHIRGPGLWVLDNLLRGSSITGTFVALDHGGRILVSASDTPNYPVGSAGAFSVDGIITALWATLAAVPDKTYRGGRGSVISSQGTLAAAAGELVQLAGQLGGSSSSPDIRGIRESNGQLLTNGIINDGQFIQRLGTDIVGTTLILDGYASEITFQENKAYWDEAIYQLRIAADGYAGGPGGSGVSEITFQENKAYWDEAIYQIRVASDGYLKAQDSGSIGDGYIAFFTGSGTNIAGDNDLYWDRVNNNLVLGSNLAFNGRSVISSPSDSNILLTNNAGSAFGNLYFGDTQTGIATSTVSLGFVLSNNARFQITNTGGAFYWDTGTGHTTFGSSVAVRDIGFVRHEAGLIRVSDGSTGYGNITVGRIIFQNGIDLGQTLDGYAGGSGTLVSRMLLGDQWLFVDGYWSVTTPAELTYVNGVPVRAFDQTTAEGAGDVWHIDSGAVTLDIAISGSAATSGFTSNNGVQLELHFRTALTSGAWTTFALTPITLTDDANIQEFTQSHSLATIGMTAGQTYQIEICRAPSDGDDTLTRDFYLVCLTVKQGA